MPHAGDREREASPAVAGRRRRVWPWLLLSVLCLAITFLGALLFSLRQEPEFYRRSRVTLADPTVRAAAVQELRAQTRQLQAAIARKDDWQLELTARQINSWLHDEFARHAPDEVQRHVRDPIVELQDGMIRLGATLDAAEFRGVLSLEVRPQLLEDAELELEFGAVRAGLVPIPATRWAATFREELGRSGWPLRISNEDPLQIRVNWRKLSPEAADVAITGCEISAERIRLSGRRAGDSGRSAVVRP